MRVVKFDEAPDSVKKLAYSLMHLCLGEELRTSENPSSLLAVGRHAGVDAATHAEGLRWYAAQQMNYAARCSGVIRVGPRKTAELALEYASRVEALDNCAENGEGSA